MIGRDLGQAASALGERAGGERYEGDERDPVFLGGSCGAFLGPLAFSTGGMRLVAIEAVALVVLGWVAYSFSRPTSDAGPGSAARDLKTAATEGVAV